MGKWVVVEGGEGKINVDSDTDQDDDGGSREDIPLTLSWSNVDFFVPQLVGVLGTQMLITMSFWSEIFEYIGLSAMFQSTTIDYVHSCVISEIH